MWLDYACCGSAIYLSEIFLGDMSLCCNIFLVHSWKCVWWCSTLVDILFYMFEVNGGEVGYYILLSWSTLFLRLDEVSWYNCPLVVRPIFKLRWNFYFDVTMVGLCLENKLFAWYNNHWIAPPYWHTFWCWLNQLVIIQGLGYSFVRTLTFVETSWGWINHLMVNSIYFIYIKLSCLNFILGNYHTLKGLFGGDLGFYMEHFFFGSLKWKKINWDIASYVKSPMGFICSEQRH